GNPTLTSECLTSEFILEEIETYLKDDSISPEIKERNNRLFIEEKRSIDELYEVFVETIRLRLSSLKAKLNMAVTKAQLNWNIKMGKNVEC
ncbi:hypothetical protein Tco_1051288, partial [Tanacetum coccineum]